VSLSGAPLARASAAGQGTAVERLLDSLGAVMEPLYGFRSLHAFKTKFSPRYEPLFLAYRDEGDLPRIGFALSRAYLPGAHVRDLVRVAAGRSG
jgi:phosphatidylglycerol lysyltransferase